MESSVPPAVEPAPVEQPLAEPQVQQPAVPISKPEPVPDPTDLSDTTESEAEKYGCKYFQIDTVLKFLFYQNFFLKNKIYKFLIKISQLLKIYKFLKFLYP